MLQQGTKNPNGDDNNDCNSSSQKEEAIEVREGESGFVSGSVKPRSKRIEAGDQKRELANLFYELITIVNTNYVNEKLWSAGLRAGQEGSADGVSPQLNSGSRPVVKKKASKPAKIFHEQNKPIPQPSKMKAQVLKKQLWPQKQPQSESLKKSGSFHQPGHARNGEQIRLKTNIYNNYSHLMSYRVHESQDQGEPSPVVNFRSPKPRTLQPSLSEYSFAHSSRNADSKERRKFSIEKSVEITVVKPILQLYISRQFQITQANQKTSFVNYTPSEMIPQPPEPSPKADHKEGTHSQQ